MNPLLSGKRQPKLDHHELTKSSFWIGQFFVVAATIIGVYLAASEGLNQALAFDYLSSQADNYYLQRSLADEYEDNLKTIEEFEQQLKSGHRFDPIQDQLSLDLFIWETMKFSKSTMETPSDILTGVRRTYRNAENVVNSLKKRKLSLSVAAQQLSNIRQQGYSETLPLILGNTKKIESKLNDAGVTL